MSTISKRVYEDLAQRIIEGKLAPGQKLEEKILADEFQVSRTPVREALRELGARGLITLLPHRGGVVANISLDQLIDMLDAECELEALCSQLASQRMSSIEKSRLQKVHESASDVVDGEKVQEYLAYNNEFHALICDGTHNATLAGMTADLRDRLAPFRRAQAESATERMQRSIEEHSKIVAAILAGDSSLAYAAMREHNARLSSGVIERLKRAEIVQKDHSTLSKSA